MSKLQTLKGFRDFLPEEKRARDWVVKKVVETFEKFGFEPLETPTLEYQSLLLGKYGTEADKLVYTFKDRGKRNVGLRYDQTVPTARVLAQHQSQLPRNFRRYQIQNVFRADKPQRGRYREFTQCDIDIFESTSPLADAEVVACTYSAFKNIGFENILVKVNDRQVLFENLKPFASKSVDVFSIIQSIDKLDKKSRNEVVSELVEKGLEEEKAKRALESIKKSKTSKNLKKIIQTSVQLGVKESDIVFEPTLARGLDYYTGMIFEIILPDYPVGSCAGGGRYDNLIKNLGGVDVPAVGVAFGFDRVVEAALKLKLVPQNLSTAQVLVTVFNDELLPESASAVKSLREAGLKCELYPNTKDDLSKQLKSADQKNIPWVVVIGPDEAKIDKVNLKNMKTGKQELINLNKVIKKLT